MRDANADLPSVDVMGRDTTAFKRLIVGRPKRNEDLGDTLLQKRIALPVFSSDALSSVAYATEAILKVLTLGALWYLYLTPWIGLAVMVLMTIVVVSYRQVVHAYPNGGGSYEVVTRNLGAGAAAAARATARDAPAAPPTRR